MKIVRRKEKTEEELERAALARMASQVQDEAHWRQILSNADTDAQREELERVIGPMLTFRRALPCNNPDCDSTLPAIWQPVLVVSNPVTPEDQSWVPIELRYCDRCKRDAAVEDFVTDGIWEQVMAHWPTGSKEEPGPLPPTRSRSTLAWDQVH